MEQALSPESALFAAVERIGSQGRMAKICGVRQPSVWRWMNVARRLPPEHVLKVEEASGISRHDLRPDIYPIDNASAPLPPADRIVDGTPAAGSCRFPAAGVPHSGPAARLPGNPSFGRVRA